MNKGALSHIRVLELSRILAGPWAGQILSDLGAEVVALLTPLFQEESSSHWIRALEAISVPYGPINTIEQVFQNP